MVAEMVKRLRADESLVQGPGSSLTPAVVGETPALPGHQLHRGRALAQAADGSNYWDAELD